MAATDEKVKTKLETDNVSPEPAEDPVDVGVSPTENRPANGEVQVKVIGAGWGRTGTNSFKTAMEILGMPCYHMVEVFKRNDAVFWDKMADKSPDCDIHSILGAKGYSATCDFPSCRFYEEQMKRYPNAKVVLTVRDPEKWYQSCMDTIFRMQADTDNCPLGIKIMTGLGLPATGFANMVHKIITRDSFQNDMSKENCIRSFIAWNEEVKRKVPAERLLVLDITKGEGWEPICSFLNIPIPDSPFPKTNDTAEFQSKANILNLTGWAIGILGLGIPFLFIRKYDQPTIAKAPEEGKKVEAEPEVVTVDKSTEDTSLVESSATSAEVAERTKEIE